MFEFKCRLRADEVGSVNAYAQGDMTFWGASGSTTSKSLMIFLSLNSLLSGLRDFLSSKNESEYTFDGIDVYFEVRFVKKGENMIVIKSLPEEAVIAEVKRKDFIPAILKGLQDFMEEAGDRLLENSDSDDIREYENLKWRIEHFSDMLFNGCGTGQDSGRKPL